MGVPEVKAAELLQWMQDNEPLTVVDVRDAASYAQGHIAGALSNPAQAFSFDMFAELPKDARIVISCYRGMMSKDVVKYLAAQGYTNAFSLKGGFPAWQHLNGAPIER